MSPPNLSVDPRTILLPRKQWSPETLRKVQGVVWRLWEDFRLTKIITLTNQQHVMAMECQSNLDNARLSFSATGRLMAPTWNQSSPQRLVLDSPVLKMQEQCLRGNLPKPSTASAWQLSSSPFQLHYHEIGASSLTLPLRSPLGFHPLCFSVLYYI